MSKQALSLMEGLLKMDPKDRLTAREALCHPWFDGMRNEQEEQSCQDYRSSQVNLRRLESANNNGATGTGMRNQESSRSRSGLRNNIAAIKVAGGNNFSQQKKLINQQQAQVEDAKSKSQGRKEVQSKKDHHHTIPPI